MITCRQIAELLIDYVSGDLAPEHCQHIQQHLKCCPPCLVYLETYQLTIRLSRQLPPAPMPPELVQRLRAVLESACEQKKKSEPEA
jgi:hypothetical protein